MEVISLDGVSETEAMNMAGVGTTVGADDNPWKTVDWRENVAKDKTGGSAEEDGVLRLKNQGSVSTGPNPFLDGALRATIIWKDSTQDLRLGLRSDPVREQYLLRLFQNKVEFTMHSKETPFLHIKTATLDPPFTSGQVSVIEFGVTGSRLVAARDGKILDVVEDHRATLNGKGFVQAGVAWIKDFAYVNLDGVPRERWPEFMRQEANGSDTEESRATSSTTPTPASVIARLDAASWKKLTPAAIAELDPKSVFAIDGEVIDASKLTGVLVRTNEQDHAVRLRVVLQKNKPAFCQITLRNDMTGGRQRGMQVSVSEQNLGMLIRMDQPFGEGTPIGKSIVGRFTVPPAGEAFDLEIAAAGQNIFVRVNGKVVAEAQDKTSVSRSGMFINSALVRIERLEYALLGSPISVAKPASSREATAPDKPQGAPQTTTTTSLTPDQQKADAIWRSRWGKPGRLKLMLEEIDTPMSLADAEPYSDFVQVGLVQMDSGVKPRWFGLRSNGMLVSNGPVPKTDNVIGFYAPTAASLFLIRAGGIPEASGKALTAYPVTQAKVAAVGPLVGSSTGDASATIYAFQRLDGSWVLQGSVFDASLLPMPDLTSPPAVQDVVVNNYGLGVLRSDGNFRFYQEQELTLPAELARGIRAIGATGTAWSVLCADGRILRCSVAKDEKTLLGANIVPKIASEVAVEMMEAGYSIIWKSRSGLWGSLSLYTTIIDELNRARPEVFAVKLSGEGKALLWIEPK